LVEILSATKLILEPLVSYYVLFENLFIGKYLLAIGYIEKVIRFVPVALFGLARHRKVIGYAKVWILKSYYPFL
jgi:hypothetical protein